MPQSDISDIYNILNQVRLDVASIRVTVDNLDHSVNGNGRPGMVDRMTIIEERQASCPARLAAKTDAKANRLSFWAVLVAGASLALTAIMALT